MRHRATALGGQWRVIRRAEGGTEIEVRLPRAVIVTATQSEATAVAR
jgi:signal transduction histidine kinase